MGNVRRLWALGAIACLAASAALAIALSIDRFPRGLAVFGCLVLALLAVHRALLADGLVRALAGTVAVAAAVGAVVLVVLEGRPLANVLVVVLFAASVLAARQAFRVHVQLPAAAPPRRPVLFFNPKSGGGKAERFGLAHEAAARGIEAIELKPGEDLA